MEALFLQPNRFVNQTLLSVWQLVLVLEKHNLDTRHREHFTNGIKTKVFQSHG